MNRPLPRPAPRRARWRYNAREMATRPDLVPEFVEPPLVEEEAEPWPPSDANTN